MAVTLSLEGKVALITGGSRGIGAETVRVFTQAGARVVFNYRTARAQPLRRSPPSAADPRTASLSAMSWAPSPKGRSLVEQAARGLGATRHSRRQSRRVAPA